MVREVFGWICFGISGIFAIGIFIISAKTRGPNELQDPRSVFELDYEHHRQLSRSPLFNRFLAAGILFGIAGFILLFLAR